MKKKLIVAFLVFGSTWYGFSQRVSQKIGTNPTIIVPSAVVEIESTTKGFLPPRMTFLERNAINSPATGLIVYCTDCGVNGELQVFNGTTWTNISGSSASARICRVPTNSGGYLVFKCHNLGADESADPLEPSWRLNGAYFQWGKKPVDTNGNNYRTKPTNGPEGFAAAPTGPTQAQSSYEINIPGWSNTPAVNGSWNLNEATPLKTLSDPCPSGFRIPTRNEWVSIYIGREGSWVNVAGGTWDSTPANPIYDSGKMVNNSLFLPAAGFYEIVSNNRNSAGIYWSSTEFDLDSVYSLFFMQNFFRIQDVSASRTKGRSIRCVAQ